MATQRVRITSSTPPHLLDVDNARLLLKKVPVPAATDSNGVQIESITSAGGVTYIEGTVVY